MKRTRTTIICLAVLLLTAGAGADVIHLKDGTTIRVSRTWEEGGWVHFYLQDYDGIVITYAKEIIDRIESDDGRVLKTYAAEKPPSEQPEEKAVTKKSAEKTEPPQSKTAAQQQAPGTSGPKSAAATAGQKPAASEPPPHEKPAGPRPATTPAPDGPAAPAPAPPAPSAAAPPPAPGPRIAPPTAPVARPQQNLLPPAPAAKQPPEAAAAGAPAAAAPAPAPPAQTAAPVSDVFSDYEGMLFYNPRREYKYWSGPNTKHRTLNDAVAALAEKFDRSPEWVQQNLGETNDLAQIYRNLSGMQVQKDRPPAAQALAANGILFYDPRRHYKFHLSEQLKFRTLDEAAAALGRQYDRSPEWVKAHLGETNDVGEIHRNLSRAKAAEPN